MCGVSDDNKPAMLGHPRWERVAVYELPVYPMGGFGQDGDTYRVPTFDKLENLRAFARKRPGLSDVGRVAESTDRLQLARARNMKRGGSHMS